MQAWRLEETRTSVLGGQDERVDLGGTAKKVQALKGGGGGGGGVGGENSVWELFEGLAHVFMGKYCGRGRVRPATSTSHLA